MNRFQLVFTTALLTAALLIGAVAVTFLFGIAGRKPADAQVPPPRPPLGQSARSVIEGHIKWLSGPPQDYGQNRLLVVMTTVEGTQRVGSYVEGELIFHQKGRGVVEGEGKQYHSSRLLPINPPGSLGTLERQPFSHKATDKVGLRLTSAPARLTFTRSGGSPAEVNLEYDGGIFYGVSGGRSRTLYAFTLERKFIAYPK